MHSCFTPKETLGSRLIAPTASMAAHEPGRTSKLLTTEE
jgi:hypothetical protein